MMGNVLIWSVSLLVLFNEVEVGRLACAVICLAGVRRRGARGSFGEKRGWRKKSGSRPIRKVHERDMIDRIGKHYIHQDKNSPHRLDTI